MALWFAHSSQIANHRMHDGIPANRQRLSPLTKRERRPRAWARIGGMLVIGWAFLSGTGCHSLPPAAPLDLSEPGWTIRQGQAIWQPPGRDVDLAGDLLVATHPDGRAFLQFTKTPLPLVVARFDRNSWSVEFVPENKSFSGRDRPSARLLWLQVPSAVLAQDLEKPVQCTRGDDGTWKLRQEKTGESIEGALTVIQEPPPSAEETR